jgi:hypothetical protein
MLKAYADAPEAVRRAASEPRRRYEAIWDGLMADLMAADMAAAGASREALRFAVLGIMNWSPEWYRADRHDLDALSRSFSAIVTRADP